MNSGAWDVDGKPLKHPGTNNSGIWLFLDRENITHFIPPNFLPPYDTAEKRKTINDFLKEEWDDKKFLGRQLVVILLKMKITKYR